MATIAELARLCHVTPKTVKFFVSEGLLQTSDTFAVAKLDWIIRAKRLGFSLAEIRQLQQHSSIDIDGQKQVAQLRDTVLRHIVELEIERDRLEKQLHELRLLAAELQGEPRPDPGSNSGRDK